MSYASRLAAAVADRGRLCVGIDPMPSVLDAWRLPHDVQGLARCSRAIVELLGDRIAVFKPQSAFFEAYGSRGIAVLEQVLTDIREAGALSLLDVKRGDIGSSFAAYADAWLAPGSPLEADAMTVAAYQGFGTLDGAFGHVRDHGKGLFVLAATSNPEAREVQTAVRADGRTVAAAMVSDAESFNRAEFAGDPVGSVGVVLGATLDLAEYGIDVSPAGRGAGPALPVLAPGFGHQGARIEEAGAVFGSLGGALLANESRGILSGGADGLGERVRARAEAIAEALHW